MKHCQKCKSTTKKLFKNSSRTSKEGKLKYNYMCVDCGSERAKKYRQTQKGKEVWRNLMRRQYRKHREKVIARQKLHQAVAKGTLIRPDICSKCKENKKVEAHHEDYSKPLEVKWVCRQCHSKV